MENEAKVKEKLFKKITRKAGVTIRDHKMIGEGDHVLAGISGGKDSMILLEILAERRDAMPFPFKITAAHIHLENVGYKAERSVLESACHDAGVDLVWVDREVNLAEDPKKSPCFVCSWHRRKILFDLTRELGCNKLALGHHRKDAVETLLLNMVYHGSISSLPYSLSMFDDRVHLIRPLLDLDENLLLDYAGLTTHSGEQESCPYENSNNREHIREFIDQLDQLHGKASYHMFKAMDHIVPDYLPQKKARTS